MHARARSADQTQWRAILSRYDELPSSPVIDLNRAIALAMVDGPAAGLAELDRLAASGDLAGYHLLPAAQADLSRRAGLTAAAAAYFRAAILLAPTEPERRYLERRLTALEL